MRFEFKLEENKGPSRASQAEISISALWFCYSKTIPQARPILLACWQKVGYSPKTVLAGTDSLFSQNDTCDKITVIMQGRYVWMTK